MDQNIQNIKDLLRAIHLLGESDPLQALADAENLLNEYPDDTLLLAEIVHLARKTNNHEKAHTKGIQAISQAVAEENGTLTRQLYLSFGENRHSLALDARTLDHMVKFFLHHKEFLDASWAAYRSATLENDLERAQKRTMEIGDLAAQQQHPQCALKIYRFYLAQHPNGILSEYAEKAIQFQERQLQRHGGEDNRNVVDNGTGEE